MTTMAPVNRTFNYMGMILDDPDPRMTPQEVKAHYSLMYPEMVNAVVEGGDFDGTNQVFRIHRQTGTKGASGTSAPAYDRFVRVLEDAVDVYEGRRRTFPIRNPHVITKDAGKAARAVSRIVDSFRSGAKALSFPHWTFLPVCF